MSKYKAKQYMNLPLVKKMKSTQSSETRLHYGIKPGSPITMKHLLSIILRCDFSELCTKFTSTFRKNKPFEVLSSVMDRNREFWHFSKLIRETVEYYGERGYGDFDSKTGKLENKLSGPFYCGMPLMALPQFNIRFCGPTSTSRSIGVAQRFGAGGIIIELQNNGNINSDRVRGFDCSWISNYTEEDEVLWAGGQYPLRVHSVRNISVDIMENYRPFCTALWCFDCMLQGTVVDLKVVKMKEKHYKIMENLINGNKNEYPQYIIDTFNAMIDQTQQIVINLDLIYEKFGKLKDLVFNKDCVEIVDHIYLAKGNMKVPSQSLFKAGLFDLYKNVEEILIYSTSNNGIRSYGINLQELDKLKASRSNDIRKITIKASRFEWKQRDPSWLLKACMDEDGQRRLPLWCTHRLTVNHEGTIEDCVLW